MLKIKPFYVNNSECDFEKKPTLLVVQFGFYHTREKLLG
jgi:hypothetical protein